MKGPRHPLGSSGQLQVTPEACTQTVWKRKAQAHMAAPERAACLASASEFSSWGGSGSSGPAESESRLPLESQLPDSPRRDHCVSAQHRLSVLSPCPVHTELVPPLPLRVF